MEGRSVGRPRCSGCRFGGLGLFWGHSEGWKPPKVGGPAGGKCPRNSILSRLAPDMSCFWFWAPRRAAPPKGPKMAQNGPNRVPTGPWGGGNGSGNTKMACKHLGNGLGSRWGAFRRGFWRKMGVLGPFWPVLGSGFGPPPSTSNGHRGPPLDRLDPKSEI